MARSRMSVQKRIREKKKAEAAALKREGRGRREPGEEGAAAGGVVAAREDLEGYGVIVEPEEEPQES